MVDKLRGAVGRYLHRVTAVRVPLATLTPDARPIVPRWPFPVFAAVLVLLNLPVYGFSLGYGLAAVPASVMLAAPVAVARYRPMLGWALGLIPLIVFLPVHRLLFPESLTPFPWLANQLAAHLPVIYLVALSAPRAICYPAVLITMVAGLSAIPQGFGYSAGVVIQGGVIWTLATVLAVVLGRTRLQRRDATIRIAEEQSQLRVLEERTRIARDLHDVVAHHMSLIAVQASTAPYRITAERPAEVDQEFRSIGAAARESLQELRQVLEVLRGATPPKPTLADLPKLVESTRAAGVPVRLILEPSPAAGPDLQYAAYRIVQEALSNVVRHAPGAAATIRVADDHSTTLTVEVINDPPATPAEPHPGGHGLTGMRERAISIGGTVQAGPTDDGGFRVLAELPLTVPIPKGRS
ncbi:sensor histidine kinase [Microlunatus parietis]|uniref:histidine kinase n=1 Tax=Microlunatus parietis TaxID=682979 RepID=A0A7Y9I5W8_9ACTN|nr:sensor histidine kinase [Microlunatus parietis]NYE70863.1 signal transduction histidine kinase [Microlunatus parietis]